MHIAVFSTKPHDRTHLPAAVERAGAPHELTFFEPRLTAQTAALVDGHDAVCVFVNDDVDATALDLLAERGVRLVLTRSAGFNHIDVVHATELGIPVARVPAYSPYAVAEHALALLLALNRKLHRAYARVRDQNFSLTGLEGFDVHGKTLGIVGTGTIGTVFTRLVRGFHCEVLAYDPYPNEEITRMRGTYVGLDELFERYRSEQIITDDTFARLLSFPNVLITSHQAFFTREALGNIADTTIGNATAFVTGEGDLHRVG